MGEKSTESVRHIRKYGNRRLYDLERSRYINRNDLRKLIAEGETVRVTDDVSGEDITRSLLMQLLSEQELGGRPVLSDALLTELIRYYEHPMQPLLGAYLQQSIETFLEQRQSLQGQVDKMLDTIPGAASARDNLRKLLDMQASILGAGGSKDRR